jgi:hypothetical protein
MNMKMESKLLLVLSVACTLYLGCLSPDAVDSESNEKKAGAIEDPDLLAGSSSRTTWPPDLVGDTSISITWKANKTLVFSFRFLDSLHNPISFKVSGTLTLYKSGGIPVLDSIPSIQVPFTDQDSLIISDSLLANFIMQNKDSVGFNVKLESPKWGNSFLLGFIYSQSAELFFNPPTSVTSLYSNYFVEGEYFFKGPCDLNNIISDPISKANSILSFYIPGTPYFWEAMPDSIFLGPLAKANYPLRLLRITELGAGRKGSEVEIFEIVQSGTKHFANFKVGTRLQGVQTETAISIRAQSQP